MNKYILGLFFLSVFHLNAQQKWFSGSVYSTGQYYLDDTKTGDFSEDNRFRSNNYLKMDARLNQFSFGLQLEGYAPQSILNFSPEFDREIGLATYYVKYESQNLNVTAGTFYEQFGSGMILRSWEDKELGLNNALEGGNIHYRPFAFLELKALYGKHRNGFSRSDGSVFGGDFSMDLSSALGFSQGNVLFGGSWVNRHQSLEHTNPEFDESTSAYAGRFSISSGNFYSNFEYVYKAKDALVEFDFVNTDALAKGSGLLLNTGYSQKGFGLDATFRRIENMSFYSDREKEGNIYNEQLVNYVPGLTKQHDYGLANIYVYQSQGRLSYNPIGKAGEIGSQIDLFYTIKKGTTFGGKYGSKIAVNYATWYGLDATFDIANRTYSSNYLSFGKKYFSDFNIEFRKKWTKKWSSIFTFIDLFYSKKYVEETSGKVDAKIAIAEATYKFSGKSSLRTELQHLWTTDDKKNWVAGTIELNVSSNLSFFVADMYNYENPLQKIHYYNFGGSFTKNRTRLALNYGRQRGGLLCVGGVCRIVPESTGIGFTLNHTF